MALEVRNSGRSFPPSGFGAFHNQLLRAAESVVFNIAEGCGANSPKEFGRFLEISMKSTIELESQLELARDYKLITPKRWGP